ncbi:MAG: hypothetical protein GQ539_01725 [Sulfitobacter sp.]|nr:hypothetical protein [Sulfitobacter sp.]
MKIVTAAVIAGLLASGAPVLAQTAKETDCAYQADVVDAVRQARLARVNERKVAAHVKAAAHSWLEKYMAIVPLVTPWVYEMKMRDVKASDLGAAWKEMCLGQ